MNVSTQSQCDIAPVELGPAMSDHWMKSQQLSNGLEHCAITALDSEKNEPLMLLLLGVLSHNSVLENKPGVTRCHSATVAPAETGLARCHPTASVNSGASMTPCLKPWCGHISTLPFQMRSRLTSRHLCEALQCLPCG